MADRRIEDLTLREQSNGAQRLTRELIEHLDQGFLPKARSLKKLVSGSAGGADPAEIEDKTVRNHVANLLNSEEFSDQVYGKLGAYCAAIDKAVAAIVEPE